MKPKNIKLISILIGLALASGMAFTTTASAQNGDYPEKAIRLVIPYGPGGATDVIFRLVTQEAEKYLDEPIVPVNMAGAGATRGSREVKDAEPDGYTLLGSHDTIATSKLAGTVDYSYNAFEPVALLTQTTNIPSTYAGHEVQSADEIAEYVEDNPGDVRFGIIPGSTDHFFWARFFQKAGIDMSNVRLIGYPDTGKQVEALRAKEIDFSMLDMPSGDSAFEEGALRPLGVAHDERLKALSDVPTLEEQGIELESATNRGLFAPKGTPSGRLDVIQNAFRKALENEEIRNRLEGELGSTTNFLTDEDYQEFLEKNETNKAKAAEDIEFDS